MECANCELRQRQFYCETCLKQHLLSYRLQIGHVTAERDAQVASAARSLLSVVEPPRLRRADLRATEDRVREIWEGLEHVRKANESARDRIQAKRDALAARRRTLAAASSPDAPSSASPSPGAAPAYAHSPPARPFLAHARNPLARAASSGGADKDRHSDDDSALARQIDHAQQRLDALSDTIARARAGLVQELVEVFSVVEVGGRPPLGARAGTRGEWTIGGLVLPVPGDMRRYPPDHINAVLTHTLHFLFLLAFYLGVKLPFEVVWSRSSTPPSPMPSYSPVHPPSGWAGISATSAGGARGTREAERPNGLLGVGTPWIGAVRGGESGGWARWSTKHPLHVSARVPSNNNTDTNNGSPSRTRAPDARPASASTSSSTSASPTQMDDSQLEDADATTPTAAVFPSAASASEGPTPHGAPSSSAQGTSAPTTSAGGSAFTTALAMLLYDVCYVAHTQGADVPLAHAGDVLGNLWAVCCSPELGRKSHATHTHPRARALPAPTPPAFALDFAQLLQATAANPSRARARGGPSREGLSRRGRDVGRGRGREVIVEEDENEEGWDLVDEV